MKLLIFGNSSSGKSTLAKQYAHNYKLAHLDLDNLAWLSSVPPKRAPVQDSAKEISSFISQHESWVIEGCYTDLIELIKSAEEVIFLNLDVATCTANARLRPWEPHKYNSKLDQDSNLPMLIEWIENYYERSDVFSFQAHMNFYQKFEGNKQLFTDNKTSITSEFLEGLRLEQ